jgi:hypothetical protein
MKRQFLLAMVFTFLYPTSCIREKSTQPHYFPPSDYEFEYIGLADKAADNLVIVHSFLYACANDRGLWRKDIRSLSASWEKVELTDTTTGHAISTVNRLFIDADNPDWMLINGCIDSMRNYGLFRTLDGGRNCEFIKKCNIEKVDSLSGYPFFSYILQYPEFILGFAENAIYKSYDFGKSWEIETKNIGAGVVERHPIVTNIIWAGGSYYDFSPCLFLSKDRGTTWENMNINNIAQQHGGVGVTSIAIDPQDFKTCYASAGSLLLKTENLGKSWRIIRQAGCYPIIVGKKSPNYILLQTSLPFPQDDPFLIESWDRGETWNRVDVQLPVSIYGSVYDEVQAEVYVLTYGGVYGFKL